MSKYRKFFVALGGFFTVLASVLSDGVVAPDEYEVVGLAALSAFFVWLVPNSKV